MIRSPHPDRFLTVDNLYVAGSYAIILGYLAYYLLR